MSKFKLINNLVGWIISILVATVYFLTLEPTASFWDSGEFISTAYKLEIPHPPGAPLYLLVGRIFSMFALSQDTVAMVINSVSAVSSALAVMFLFWSIGMISLKMLKQETAQNQMLSMGAGALGALSFAFTDTFWYSATEAEVYGLSTLFIAIIFWAILKWDRLEDPSSENRWLVLIAFITGLSVGVHLLNLLAIPSLGLVVYFKKSKTTTKKGIFLALFASAGVLVFVMYGLVWMATIGKYLEIFMVNSMRLPFGAGIAVLVVAISSALIVGVRYTHKRKKVMWNTVLLAASFVIIGYSSYTTILIRANYGTPVNQNDPKDVLGLIYYLRMEQYPTRPLLFGKEFTSEFQGYENVGPVYEMGEKKYEVKDQRVSEKFKKGDEVLLPRMWSTLQASHPQEYREIMGLKPGEKPSFSDHMIYMVKHQMGEMYFRYFLWNFAGREGSIQGAGWLRPWDYFKKVPEVIQRDKARNNYFMLPLILGFIGLYFMFRKDPKQFAVVATLFLMTGFVLVGYLNGPPSEPRERDYIYVGSYYAYSIWLGIGFLGIVFFLRKLVNINNVWVPRLVFAMTLLVPVMYLITNFDDHDRSERYFSAQTARNTLAACEPNAILFTGGDNDTYPLWYVQEVEGFRQDVRVVVLSYANVDWYINPMFRQVNASEALPLTLEPKDYKQGGPNDYLLVVDNPSLQQGIDLSKYLKLVKQGHKGIKAQVSTGTTTIVPSKKIILNTDSSSLIKNGVIPDKHKHLASNKIDFEVKGRGLQKRDLLILDLIDTNRWERPIYFNYTSMNQVSFDVSRHVIQVGDIMRLLPINNQQTDRRLLVDTEKMYENLVEKAAYTNLDDASIHYHGYYNFFANNVRNHFNALARTLVNEGDLDTAKKVIHTSIEKIPNEAIPYSVNSIATVELLLASNDKDTADHVAQTMVDSAIDWLEYAKENKLSDGNLNTQRSLLTLSEFTRYYARSGHNEEAKRYNELFRKYYQNG